MVFIWPCQRKQWGIDSIISSAHGRTSHGGVQWYAVHGDNASRLRDSEGAQLKLCHPTVYQRLPSGG